MINKDGLFASNTCWYTFYTAPRAEKKCEDRLLTAGYDVFLPKITVTRFWKTGKKKISLALFSNYLFVNVTNRQRIEILQIPGILYTVSFNGRPAVVSSGEIDQLKIAQRDPEHLAIYTDMRPPVRGIVQVEEGPLQGLCGEVLEHRGDQYIIVRINSIRQSFRVQIDSRKVRLRPVDHLLVG